MIYDKYRKRMDKVVKILAFLSKYRFAIISALVALTLSVSWILFARGTVSGYSMPINEFVYGDVELRIPEGVQHGQVFRMKGKGFKSIRGNGVGDQLVHVIVKTPTRLSRDERELYEKLREADKKSNNETIFEKFKKAFKK